MNEAGGVVVAGAPGAGSATETAALEALGRSIAACRLCRDQPLKGEADRLPHEPFPVAVLSTTARVLVAGQAPGLRVHNSGLPFNDASGDRLRSWMGVSREQFYDPALFAIVPMGLCFPGYDENGHDLPPRRECAPHWRARILEAMPQVEVVLAIGQYAQKWHIGAARKATMTETVSHWQDYFFTNRGPRVLPLPHPSWRNTAWLRRNPWFEEKVLPQLRQTIEMLCF